MYTYKNKKECRIGLRLAYSQ